MPRTPCAMRFDPRYGRSTVVDITTPAGPRPTVYTTENGSTTHILPVTVSSETDFWFTGPGTYVLSATIDGVEAASQFGTTRTFSVNGSGVVKVDVGADLEELLAGQLGGSGSALAVLKDANGDVTFTDFTALSGAATGGILRNVSGVQANNSFTQTADWDNTTGISPATPFYAKIDQTLNYAGGAQGPNAATGMFGPRGAVQVEGTLTVNNNQGAVNVNAIGFADQRFIKNNTGGTRNIASSHHIMTARIYYADGGAVTLNANDFESGSAGFVSNMNTMTTGSGTFTANTIYGFLDRPWITGNSTVTNRVAYEVGDPNESGVGNVNALADVLGATVSPAVTADHATPTLTNNYGLRVGRMVGGTNNWGIRCDTPSVFYGDTVTFTANPLSPIAINGTHTMNVAAGAGAYPNIIDIAPTIKWQLEGALVSFNGGVSVRPTIQATAINQDIIRIGTGYNCNPIFHADTFTGVTGVLWQGYSSAPTLSRNGSGVITAATIQGFTSSATVNTGNTITTLQHFNVSNAGGSGTVTTQIGLDIAAMAKGGTKNRAIRIAASTAGSAIEWGAQTNNDTTTSNPASTTSMYTRGGILVFAYNDAGTMRFTSTPMTGTTNPAVWTHGTSGP